MYLLHAEDLRQEISGETLEPINGATTGVTDRDLAVTLAGGGNRAFFQLGLLNQWWDALSPRLGALSTCSAGACVAVILIGGRQQATLDFWLKRRAHVKRNFDWSRLLFGERPAPHFPVYRDTLEFALAEGGLERLRAQPFPVVALTAAPPHGLPIPLAVPLGLGAYSLERWRHPGRLHPGSGRRLGFEAVTRDLRTCETVDEVVAWVLASSATPPFTPVGMVNGRRVLDGGLVDNAPAFVADRLGDWHRHLVVLTRKYPDPVMGRHGNRWYLCPSVVPPADRWDYTRPERVMDTIALGEADGACRREEFDRWLAEE